MFLKAERKLHENTVFLIIQEENTDQPFYKISNQSSEYEVQVYQIGFKNDKVSLSPGDATPFAWSDQKEEHLIRAKVFLDGQLASEEEFRVSIDILNQKLTVRLHGQKRLHVTTFTDGYTKVLLFSDGDG